MTITEILSQSIPILGEAILSHAHLEIFCSRFRSKTRTMLWL
uniref:Uncharacterized protein n=1 Tax=Rhizophora mucronata TaxID=61149 RepID=A0A2P2QXC2_RHIMU